MTTQANGQSGKWHSRRALLAGVAALAALPALRAPAEAFAVDQLAAARRKLDAYSDLYEATHSFASSWQRYLQFVDPDNGPRGRESRINGLAPPPAAESELAAAERLLATAPVVAEADRAAKALIQFYREAAPKMAEAAAFFETYGPKDDQGRAGQVLHRGIRSAMTFTVDARTDLFKATDALRGEIEPLELTMLASRGKGPHWHVRRASVEARKVRDALPVAPGAFDPAVLASRLDAFGAVAEDCKAFDAANPGKLAMFGTTPSLFLMSAQRLRDQIAARSDSSVVTRDDIMSLHTSYAQLVTLSDLFFRNHP